MVKRRNKQLNPQRILLLSDLHFPVAHPDALKFLKALKEKIRPTLVIAIGDLCDNQALSNFERNPNLPGALDELRETQKSIKKLFALFPDVIAVTGNHDLRPQRLASKAGLPTDYLKDMPTLMNSPKGWVWKCDLTLQLPTGEDCFFTHDAGKGVRKAIGDYGMCIVAGHYHTKLKITYAPNHYALNWGMQVGCLIDDDHPAFNYMRNSSGRKRGRSVLGTGAIIDGKPVLYPMRLRRGGRWTGKI